MTSQTRVSIAPVEPALTSAEVTSEPSCRARSRVAARRLDRYCSTAFPMRLASIPYWSVPLPFRR